MPLGLRDRLENGLGGKKEEETYLGVPVSQLTPVERASYERVKQITADAAERERRERESKREDEQGKKSKDLTVRISHGSKE